MRGSVPKLLWRSRSLHCWSIEETMDRFVHCWWGLLGCEGQYPRHRILLSWLVFDVHGRIYLLMRLRRWMPMVISCRWLLSGFRYLVKIAFDAQPGFELWKVTQYDLEKLDIWIWMFCINATNSCAVGEDVLVDRCSSPEDLMNWYWQVEVERNIDPHCGWAICEGRAQWTDFNVKGFEDVRRWLSDTHWHETSDTWSAKPRILLKISQVNWCCVKNRRPSWSCSGNRFPGSARGIDIGVCFSCAWCPGHYSSKNNLLSKRLW